MNRTSLFLATAVALAGTVSCGDGENTALPVEEAPAPAAEPDQPQAQPEEEQTGSLSLALTLQGVEFDAFNYAITGPNFTKAGGIDVSDSSTVSALIEGIPAASGYSITLSGTSTAPEEATCSGSAAFDVTADEVTNVPVAVACHLLEEEPIEEEPAKVPLPPLAPFALGLLLLAVGCGSARRRPGPLA